jgi:hypothetical protein
MQQAEQAQVDAAYVTLQRMRGMRVKFHARWTRMDDLLPEDERSLKDAMAAAWTAWAHEHGITDAEVQGPSVITTKPDYLPFIGGELPG